ncbi:MAG: Gfo/Idh/MocA family oxidoreductase, partial [Abditibacteriaceae bacterium]
MNIMEETVTSAPLVVPAMDEVRWGFIGVGGRGHGHLKTILQMQNSRVTAVCDNFADNVDSAAATVREKTEKDPATYGSDGDEDAWKCLLERDDVDAVVISTEWQQHAVMGIEAMKA